MAAKKYNNNNIKMSAVKECITNYRVLRFYTAMQQQLKLWVEASYASCYLNTVDSSSDWSTTTERFRRCVEWSDGERRERVAALQKVFPNVLQEYKYAALDHARQISPFEIEFVSIPSFDTFVMTWFSLLINNMVESIL